MRILCITNEGMQRMKRTEEIAQLVSQWPTSGLSKAVYARTHGIGLSTLQRRVRRSQQLSDVVPHVGASFVEVGIGGDVEPGLPSSHIVITLASGTRIEVR